MLSLAEFLHPITPEAFQSDYYGRKPLHIPAEEGGSRQGLLTWGDWNHLLNQPGLWSSQNLRLMRDHIPVRPDQYCRALQTANGPVNRPWMPKLEIFLSAGSSLVANEVHQLHPPLTRTAAMLGEAFAAGIGSNVYYSSEGIRAFGTHFDNHEVFAVQTEGEKLWNIYENRSGISAESMPDNMETRRWFEQTRGELLTQVHMKAGDLLYLPRGWYHDALATTGPSLHVTLAVNPLHGRAVLGLLERMALQNSLFRDWLPSARIDGGAPLQTQLKAMGQAIADVVGSPAFMEEIARIQQRMVERPADFTLPHLKPVTLYRTTGRAFPAASPDIRTAYGWAIQERQFAIEDLIAQFDFISESDMRAGLAAAEQAGAVQRV